jgi:hypothetical protein
MLNKIQSNKRNSWVCHDFCLLLAFMFLFQVEVVAQEKVQKSNYKIQTSNPATTYCTAG